MLQNEDILRLSHKVAQSGHWYIRLNDNTLFWSEEVFLLHGMSPNAIPPTVDNALSFYHPNDRDRVEALINETIETGKPLSFDARIVRVDGDVRWVETLGELKSSPASNTRYLFGIFRDITENQQQRMHNQRLAWVLENTQELILMTDSNGRINWANSAFETLSGYSLEEARGHEPGDLLQGPETDPQTIAYMRDCLARQQGFSCEVLNYTKGGAYYWLRISCQPEFDSDGELYGFNSIQTDITQNKQIRLDLEAEINERRRLEEQLRYLATHDELSTLPNRRHFLEQAEKEVERAIRHGRPLSLLMIDMDHFKRINDQYGHSTGDEVIQAFAERCQGMLRKSDTAARIGGEEFSVLLPETGNDSGRQMAERLRSLIAHEPIHTQAGPIHLTLSIGVSTYSKASPSVEAMIQEADRHLYEAKDNGRDQVV
ncbi:MULTISPECIES: sensor domain-containing diguanylate cyclase [Halomonadaceae]|uniref:Diguanylate cyclase n=1 Tax=Vreelandella halophila TaxID=86177 RepID=A0A9X4YCD3_9GAMM|nr:MULTISPECIES: sensor domain-containing diguanylate cyclase [Halomonas]MYL27262.1 diguanylate cyclase [Halomonas utahensis]MYL74464.1 diguanylate cyclase [Halomonas sp. 22501_18_FS]